MIRANDMLKISVINQTETWSKINRNSFSADKHLWAIFNKILLYCFISLTFFFCLSLLTQQHINCYFYFYFSYNFFYLFIIMHVLLAYVCYLKQHIHTERNYENNMTKSSNNISNSKRSSINIIINITIIIIVHNKVGCFLF